MFTGIVEAFGTIKTIDWHDDCMRMRILPMNHFNDLKVGDSVSVNGVCLTITSVAYHGDFEFEIVPETLRLTNLSLLKEGSLVNLERSMRGDSRIGGHYVQGHVDECETIIDIQKDGAGAIIVKISLTQSLRQLVVNKGYIALDGMSITVIEAIEDWFSVTFIPHTQAVTIVGQYQIGTKVNVEVDILGKYVKKLLGVK